jgi:PilZ domain-containing protein
MEERRRSPRRPVDTEFVKISSADSVRVLDISAAGVLFQTPSPLSLGARGQLRLSVGGAPLLAEIEVRRVSVAPDSSPGYRIGAKFVAMTPKHRQLIERFISQ